jgi:hypothetical protein
MAVSRFLHHFAGAPIGNDLSPVSQFLFHHITAQRSIRE